MRSPESPKLEERAFASRLGNHPPASRWMVASWNAAAPGPVAQPLVDAVVAELRARGLEVATGLFGADMAVELVNDGPVTILLESAPDAAG